MNYQQLIELVIKIQAVDGSEAEIDRMVDLFISKVPDPHALDYLFAKQFEDLTPKGIVDKALAYKPIIL